MLRSKSNSTLNRLLKYWSTCQYMKWQVDDVKKRKRRERHANGAMSVQLDKVLPFVKRDNNWRDWDIRFLFETRKSLSFPHFLETELRPRYFKICLEISRPRSRAWHSKSYLSRATYATQSVDTFELSLFHKLWLAPKWWDCLCKQQFQQYINHTKTRWQIQVSYS